MKLEKMKKGSRHTWEKFCIQVHSFKLIKNMDFKHVFRIENGRKSSFRGKI